MKKAFTLIEALIALAVIAVLIAITVPMLGRTRESARSAANLSNLRQLAIGWSTYAGESGGVLPYFIDPKIGSATVTVDGESAPIQVEYFQQTNCWPMWMGKSGHCPAFGSAALFTPWTFPARRTTTSYYSPCGGRVDPAHYVELSFRELPAQLRAVGIAEVQFPARKTILSTRMPESEGMSLGGGPDGQTRWGAGVNHAAMFDGHAAAVRSEQMLTDWGGDGFANWHGSHLAPLLPLIHGAEGVRGRDIRD